MSKHSRLSAGREQPFPADYIQPASNREIELFIRRQVSRQAHLNPKVSLEIIEDGVLIGLTYALQKFDAKKQGPGGFFGFASVAIGCRVINEIKKQNAQKRGADITASYAEQARTGEDGSVIPWEPTAYPQSTPMDPDKMFALQRTLMIFKVIEGKVASIAEDEDRSAKQKKRKAHSKREQLRLQAEVKSCFFCYYHLQRRLRRRHWRGGKQLAS